MIYYPRSVGFFWHKDLLNYGNLQGKRMNSNE